jgi:glycosyltransferase involved in cell wall biosynthesis
MHRNKINEKWAKTQIPMVSVGLPVFNSEATVGKAIESILSQTYHDFELIISDNASTDNTEAICMKYCALDSRIRFIRQEENIGAGNNFQLVFSQARGTYFMWAAADDTRTANFIEQTVFVLENNSNCVFSSTANCFEGQEKSVERHQNFELKGSLYSRLTRFFDICWNSHGCFYSMIRKSALNEAHYIEEKYLAADWAVIVSLLVQGEFCRAKDGLQILGDKGSSMQSGYMRSMCKTPIEFIAPLIRFSIIVFQLGLQSKKLTMKQLTKIFNRLIVLNITVVYMLYREELSRFAKKLFFKP